MVARKPLTAKEARKALAVANRSERKATNELVLVNVGVRIRGSEALAVLTRLGKNFHFHQLSVTRQYKEGVIAVLLQSGRAKKHRDLAPWEQVDLLLGMQHMVEIIPGVEVLNVPVVAVVNPDFTPVYVLNELIERSLGIAA